VVERLQENDNVCDAFKLILSVYTITNHGEYTVVRTNIKAAGIAWMNATVLANIVPKCIHSQALQANVCTSASGDERFRRPTPGANVHVSAPVSLTRATTMVIHIILAVVYEHKIQATAPWTTITNAVLEVTATSYRREWERWSCN